jgi:hypothetical protein
MPTLTSEEIKSHNHAQYAGPALALSYRRGNTSQHVVHPSDHFIHSDVPRQHAGIDTVGFTNAAEMCPKRISVACRIGPIGVCLLEQDFGMGGPNTSFYP